jgi:hypothetical protein
MVLTAREEAPDNERPPLQSGRHVDDELLPRGARRGSGGRTESPGEDRNNARKHRRTAADHRLKC